MAVEKLNMRAVFAVSVGDEKKLARVFGAANERRWTRSDYAEGKQGEELYMSNNQNRFQPRKQEAYLWVYADIILVK